MVGNRQSDTGHSVFLGVLERGSKSYYLNNKYTRSAQAKVCFSLPPEVKKGEGHFDVP